MLSDFSLPCCTGANPAPWNILEEARVTVSVRLPQLASVSHSAWSTSVGLFGLMQATFNDSIIEYGIRKVSTVPYARPCLVSLNSFPPQARRTSSKLGRPIALIPPAHLALTDACPVLRPSAS